MAKYHARSEDGHYWLEPATEQSIKAGIPTIELNDRHYEDYERMASHLRKWNFRINILEGRQIARQRKK